MKKFAFILAILTLVHFGWTQSSFAQTLYGAAATNGGGGGGGGAAIGPSGEIGPGENQSNFYTIDPETGAATLIGPIGFSGVTGMAFLSDGTLLASARGDDQFGDYTSLLIQIDPTTGAGTLIGIIGQDTQNGCGRIPGLTYDRIDQILFGYGDSCPDGTTDTMVIIDPVTGAGTLAPNPTGFVEGGNGLAIQANTGNLFATPADNGSLVTLDPVTGIATEIAASVGNIPNRISSLDFNPLTGVLFASFNDDEDTGNFYLLTIDTTDGTTTTIGQTVQGLDAIVFTNFCGDGQVVPGEECDDGNDINDDDCSNACLINLCGNGIINPGETCDDGNRIDGDGCSSLCVAEVLCGNGIVDEGEQCDDGNDIDNDSCTNTCVILLNFDVSGSGCALNPRSFGAPAPILAMGFITLLGMVLIRGRLGHR